MNIPFIHCSKQTENSNMLGGTMILFSLESQNDFVYSSFLFPL